MAVRLRAEFPVDALHELDALQGRALLEYDGIKIMCSDGIPQSCQAFYADDGKFLGLCYIGETFPFTGWAHIMLSPYDHEAVKLSYTKGRRRSEQDSGSYQQQLRAMRIKQGKIKRPN